MIILCDITRMVAYLWLVLFVEEVTIKKFLQINKNSIQIFHTKRCGQDYYFVGEDTPV